MRSLFYPIVMLIVILVVLVGLVLVRPQAWWPEGPRNVSQLLQLAATAKPIPRATPPATKAEPPATKGSIGAKVLAKAQQPGLIAANDWEPRSLTGHRIQRRNIPSQLQNTSTREP